MSEGSRTVLYRIAFWLLAAALTLCCHSAPEPVPVHRAGTVPSRDERAVIVAVSCSAGVQLGSGVYVARYRVLTALHVLRCAGAGAIAVSRVDGNPVSAQAVRSWPEHDTVELVTEAPNGGAVANPGRAEPELGAWVCAEVAVPVRFRRCGPITYNRMKPSCVSGFCYDFRVDTTYDRGNSGAGIYDESGRLVGLVTGRTPDPDYEGASMRPGFGAYLPSEYRSAEPR